jgi:hypothetical protein
MKESIKIKKMPEIKKSDYGRIQLNSQIARSITMNNVGIYNHRGKQLSTIDSTVATSNNNNNPTTSSKRVSNRLRVSREAIFQNSLLFQGINIITKIKPKSRSQPCCFMQDNLMMIFGGLNGQGLDDLWVCDLRDNFNWFKVKTAGKDTPTGRFGHTAVIYRREIYFFGGVVCDSIAPEEDILIYSISIFYS